ncbi:hypothetical protein GN958_ATG15388 [Phytophthora infestans]|uniref:DUF6818 domain-containing protein n=1 Tax=Phytophthora infestans TaxID=4787 RepID=A0A8S9U711_PHYIN|nr:hypothetical protein GN958_ATG15388 [Phytophthora infestans]
MWKSVAVEYNSLRARSWSERDYDSLRRKFRTLYGKPKPTGNQGEEDPLRHRPVLMAHEIQAAIELKGVRIHPTTAVTAEKTTNNFLKTSMRRL